MLKVVGRNPAGEESGELLPLDEIARVGARRMLMAALEVEAADYVERHRQERDAAGCALVVRNGRAKARKLTLGAGTVELRAPRVNDRRRDDEGRRQRFSSRILPPYMRRSPKVAEVLPVCGELLILPESAIRHTHIWTAPERKTVSGVR